jgi:hypothetical protein
MLPGDCPLALRLASVDGGRIERARVLAVPLYTIKRVEDAEQLFSQVRKSSEVHA